MLATRSPRVASLMSVSRRPNQPAQLLCSSAPVLLGPTLRQRRQFWFGAWKRDCDPDAYKHARRRLRSHRYGYRGSFDLEWPPRQDYAQTDNKTTIAYSLTRNPMSSKYISLGDVKSWSDELSGVRSGRSSEDIETENMDHHWLFGPRQGRSRRSLHSVHDYLQSRKKTVKDVTPESVLRATIPARDCETGFGPKDQNDELNSMKHNPSGETSRSLNHSDRYKFAKRSERDGQARSSGDGESEQYDNLQRHAEVDITPEKVASDTSVPQPDDLAKYRPLEWNEPDGLREPTPEELSKDYKDLDQYGPVMWNEPDGLRKLTPEEESKNYTDLGAYRKPFVAAESVLRAHESRQLDPTPKAVPVPPKVEVEASPQDPAEKYTDLHKYGPVRWNEPDGLCTSTPEELSKNYKDLHKYGRYPNDGPAGVNDHPEDASKEYSDLEGYRSFEHEAAETKANEAAGSYKLDSKPLQGDDDSSGSSGFDEFYGTDGGHLTAAGIRNDVLRRAHRNKSVSSQKKTGLNENEEKSLSGVVHEEGSSEKEHSSLSKGLTGNYAIDFPDEFSTSWGTSNSWSKTTLFPQNLSKSISSGPAPSAGAEMEEADVSSMDESFPHESSRLQPSLDRNASRVKPPSATPRSAEVQLESDPFSKSPQGLEVNYAEECDGKATWPTFVQHYRGRTSAAEARDAESVIGAVSEDQPVQYKMLAYDNASRCVKFAETSSAVMHDAKPPADPAEILLRVSNPSKFFPYFSALQAEGFELVSGGGDLLVFRKMRQVPSYRDEFGSAVNPIDMMGRSGASNFASPTGYVNYESPQYRSGVLGQGADTHVGPTEKKKKRSLGRRVVIGTAWVAGTAYAVSVVGEYFSTGGRVF